MGIFKTIQHKYNIYSKILSNSSLKTILLRLAGKFFVEVEYFYLVPEKQSTSNIINIERLSLPMILRFYGKKLNKTEQELKRYEQQIHNQSRQAFGIVKGQEICSIAWVEKAQSTTIPSKLKKTPKPVLAIVDCFTTEANRGQGLYPKILKALVAKYQQENQLIIYTHNWNKASQRGIQKADFEFIARRVKIKILDSSVFWF